MPAWLTGREEEVLALVAQHGPDLTRIAATLGTTHNALDSQRRRNPILAAGWDAARARYQAARAKPFAATPDEGSGPPAATRHGSTVESRPLGRILTLEELLAAAQVDRTEWVVERFKVNKWEVGAKHPETGAIIVAPLFQVTANLVRPGLEELVKRLREAVVADVRADAVRRQATPVASTPRALVRGRHALEVCLMDLHIGKLAWAEETGDDYDSRIAEARARAAVTELLTAASVYELEEIILPLGNDYFHYDSIAGLTTAGTPQDRDTRLHKMFRKGRGLASWMIHECARVAPVRVVVVPGNHDEVLSWMLGEVLAAEFAHDARVTVDNSPKLRKYVEYGANLIGYTHGKDEPHGKLPLIMAQEAAEAWARTTAREWHTGHFHHSKVRDATPVDSHNGVRVRVLQSLSGTDAWHYRKGYIGQPREAEAFVWARSGGLRANLFAAGSAAGRVPDAA
jgi:hypothetical protein